jgi:hypothetical protein
MPPYPRRRRLAKTPPPHLFDDEVSGGNVAPIPHPSLLSPSVAHDEPIDLVLDALVKQEFFFPVFDAANKTGSPWQLVAVMYHRVRGFIAACTASGFRLHWVMDCGWRSEEAHEKWRSRREEEVGKQMRNFPIGLDSILSDFLEECGQRWGALPAPPVTGPPTLNVRHLSSSPCTKLYIPFNSHFYILRQGLKGRIPFHPRLAYYKIPTSISHGSGSSVRC